MCVWFFITLALVGCSLPTIQYIRGLEKDRDHAYEERDHYARTFNDWRRT